jgi:putative Mg2+ transporter-C (MgtC) family protein
MPHVIAQLPPGIIGALRLDLLAKLALSVILGGAIGMEREVSGKPAGLRTNILICLGSTLLMDLSMNVGVLDGGPRVGDPGRIAAQIVTGIGFLGAGTILQSRGAVIGLTTAATIWVVAAIGMIVGAGQYLEAVGSTALVVVVLTALQRVERRIMARHRRLNAVIRARRGAIWNDIEKEIRSTGVSIVSHKAFDHESDVTFEVFLSGPARQFDVITARLLEHAQVLSVQIE